MLGHILLFWPLVITIIVIAIITLSVWLTLHYPVANQVLVASLIVAGLRCLSSTTYTSPNNWWWRSTLREGFPTLKEAGWRITDRSGFDHRQQAIYIWYPHSHFAMVPYGLFCGEMGSATFKRPVALCCASYLFNTPALREFGIAAGLVNADMDDLRGTIKQGTSLCIIPGGVREMMYTVHNKMRLIDGRSGFLHLARATGLPLIPIFCYGENEMFERQDENDHARVIPSNESIVDWFKRPLRKSGVRIYIGEPMTIKSNAGERRWRAHIERLYSFTKPAHYADSVEWIVKKRRTGDRKH
jgi:hypothetical protein